MKKNAKSILAAFLVLVLISGICFYIFRKQIVSRCLPELTQTGNINIVIANDSIEITSLITIRNKLPIKIGIDSINYKVDFCDKTFLNNKKFLGIELDDYQLDTLSISLKIPYSELLKDIKAEKKNSDSTYFILNIDLQLSTFLGKVDIPINIAERVQIPQPPTIEVVHVKFKTIHRKSVSTLVTLKIVNFNNIDLTINEINYSMKIVDLGNIMGNYNKLIKIKPLETVFVELPITIHISKMGKMIFNIIRNRDTYDYVLKLNAHMESTIPIDKSFHIDITKDGKMELIKN